MRLERLELQGFKSFADKTALDFKPSGTKEGSFGITAIVGPNGSGKSNFADAVRWVMGTQSVKQIRGKKSEDVIFSGSEKRPRMNVAEVHLTLNNEDHSSEIEYEKLVLSRRLYRDGESEYLVNKNKARLSDIQLLLAKANMGQRTYSVIGQGMIDQVLVATPQERKEFFDEAAGVKQFQIKRNQALNKLEASEENLSQAEALLQEIEPRMKTLTRQVKRLERRGEVEVELKTKQISYYGSHWRELAGQRANFEDQFKKLESLRQKKAGEVKAIQEKLSSLEKEESRSTVFEELQKEYERLMGERNKLREEEMALRSKIEIQKRIETKLPSSLPVATIVEHLEKISSAQKKLFEKIKGAQSVADLEALKYQAAELSDAVSALLEKIKNPAAAKKTSIDPALLADLETFAKKIKIAGERVAETQTKMSAFHKEEEKKKGAFFEFQRDFQGRQMELNELTGKVNDVKIELARLDAKKEDLEAEIKTELTDMSLVENAPKSEGGAPDDTWSEIQRLKHQLELIGSLDEETLKEYEETKERYDFLSTQTTDLRSAIESLEKIIEELDVVIKKQFDDAFATIQKEFQKYFKMLFSGGKADLVLEKEVPPEESEETETNPESETAAETFVSAHDRVKKLRQSKLAKMISGIEIKACPPGKKLKNISMLSGGERALTSIALICAIISNNPAPFVVLDEVDAALDESNSIRFSDILVELSNKTQFVVITHNRYTMEKAGVIYGVTMGEDGVSQLLSIELEAAKQWSSK